tara:strand:+ start:66664 stop:68112 length:1449 start_codon:yes stop_codon:yes gene_type:complete
MVFRRSSQDDKPMLGLKTGSFERRLSLTKAGVVAGGRLASSMAGSMFSGKEKKAQSRREAYAKQAAYLVKELSHLKGSVVKIGQVMALYGEHFLPPEVTEALHTLEDQNLALDWGSIEPVLIDQLGREKLDQLEIERTPIGAASLGQVHRATRKSDGRQLCLKIQYPGVAAAVDSDLNAVASILKVARLVSRGPEFNEWLEEVRSMMHREVDYELELRTTRRFHEKLKDDSRFIVPEVFPEFSGPQVMCMSYEAGISPNHAKVHALPQARRNDLAKAALELFLEELFVWGELQTDPNFGNYRVRLGDEGDGPAEPDKLILLDFGAVQRYPASFLDPVCEMIRASYERDLDAVVSGAVELKFMRAEWPMPVLCEFAEVCMATLEPLMKHIDGKQPGVVLNDDGEYCWKQSDLPSRIARRATRSAISRYFKIPPKEFVFLNRKLIGVYTFIAVMEAEFNGAPLLEKYLYDEDVKTRSEGFRASA